MKLLCIFVIGVFAAIEMPWAHAQTRAWRCGMEYTNDPASARRTGCRLLPESPSQQFSASHTRLALEPVLRSSVQASASQHPRMGIQEQHARDAETRFILLTELKKAQDRQVQLLRDYKLDARAKPAEMIRNESDIAAIQREIARLPARQHPALVQHQY